MRIGELSRRTSVSRDTIRFYERNGLISSDPGQSSTNTYRNYPEDTVLTLQLIQEAQTAGFSLAELRLFIRTLDESSNGDFDAEAFLDQKIDEVERNITRSRRFLKTLKQTKTVLQQTH